jgi:hypothetical protein
MRCFGDAEGVAEESVSLFGSSGLPPGLSPNSETKYSKINTQQPPFPFAQISNITDVYCCHPCGHHCSCSCVVVVEEFIT